MRLMSRIVSLLVVMLVGLMGSRAEASRMSFNGLGAQGAIVWDGDGDVATMASQCGGGSVCETTLFGLGILGVLVTPDAEFTLADLNITAIHLLLTPATLPNCSGFADVQCGPLNVLAANDGLSDEGWATQPFSGDDPDVSNNSQNVIRLAMGVSSNPSTPSLYTLSAGSLAFLATLDPTTLAAYHMGIDVTRNNPNDSFTGFTVETVPATTTAPVPEPGTLLLLGSGLAVFARARRRAVR